MLAVSPSAVATRVYIQLMVQGFAFADGIEVVDSWVATAKSAFVASFRTSDAVADAITAAKNAGYEAIKPSLEAAYREIVAHEAALASHEAWP